MGMQHVWVDLQILQSPQRCAHFFPTHGIPSQHAVAPGGGPLAQIPASVPPPELLELPPLELPPLELPPL